MQVGDGIWEIDLGSPLPQDFVDAHVKAEVADQQGSFKRVDVRFSTAASGPLFLDGFEGSP